MIRTNAEDGPMRSIAKMWWRLRRATPDLLADRRGLAAVEFAFILPVMMVMLFGTVEFSSAIAVDRKITLMARTLSDLTSQATYVGDGDLTNFFTASIAIMYPYTPTPTNARLSEIYVNASKKATIQWSKAATISSGATQATLTTSIRGAGDDVTTLVPPSLLVANTYLILSEVSYLYVPTVGYVLAKAGITMSDSAFTRPRQSTCVYYPTAGTTCPIS
jgi:Flp pilus assembly protein TadG